jgi:hypothetical protein
MRFAKAAETPIAPKKINALPGCFQDGAAEQGNSVG